MYQRRGLEGWGWAKGAGHLTGTEFQFYRKKFWSLVTFTAMKINLARLNCTRTIVNMILLFILFYYKVPAYNLTDRHCAQAQGDGVIQPSTHDPEVVGPSVRLRFPQKNMLFQSIHRPPGSQRGNSRVRTDLEKRLLPTSLWTLQLQGNVNRNKTPCKT